MRNYRNPGERSNLFSGLQLILPFLQLQGVALVQLLELLRLVLHQHLALLVLELLQLLDGRLRRRSRLFQLPPVFHLEPGLLGPVPLLLGFLELKMGQI